MNSTLKMFFCILFSITSSVICKSGKGISLPEHPRPDFMRETWENLNDPWKFRFDKNNNGLDEKWYNGKVDFDKVITVPFSWRSKLSGVKDEADIGWYSRTISIPKDWKELNKYIVIGVCDWITKVWIDGNYLGEHKGGYTHFEFDLTNFVETGSNHNLVIRVDDSPNEGQLYGKQGYGRIAGIWQTTYLEAKSKFSLDYVHFTPDIDNNKVIVKAGLNAASSEAQSITLDFHSNEYGNENIERVVPKGEKDIQFEVQMDNARLWTLYDPYLHYVDVTLNGDDKVSTYFGMRKISVVNLPGTDYPYVALNNKHIYLQLLLDQSYHRDGYYTFPSDDFMLDEILRSRRLGLNGQRIHIKVEIPRKLYWAFVPNSCGQPSETSKAKTEYCLQQMIKRDYNHPSIFSWVNFNETWGLFTKEKGYT